MIKSIRTAMIQLDQMCEQCQLYAEQTDGENASRYLRLRAMALATLRELATAMERQRLADTDDYDLLE